MATVCGLLVCDFLSVSHVIAHIQTADTHELVFHLPPIGITNFVGVRGGRMRNGVKIILETGEEGAADTWQFLRVRIWPLQAFLVSCV